MGHLIVLIDDSTTATKRTALMVRGILTNQDIQIQSFQGVEEFQAYFEKNPMPPWIIFTDYVMPGQTGLDLIDWLKRHPILHWTPVCMMTGEIGPETRVQATKAGAWEFLEKPIEPESLEKVFAKRKNTEIDYEELKSLDHGFSEETMDLVGNQDQLLSDFGEPKIRELYRIFHTIKGTARSLQLPAISNLAHEAESFLTAVTHGNMYSFPQTLEILKKVLGFFEDQCDSLKSNRLLLNAPKELLDEIHLFKANVAAGWKMGGAPAGSPDTTSPQNSPAQTAANQGGVVGRTATSVRINNDRLDMLQVRLKKILGIKFRLSQFTNQLQQEFFDEPFPKELLKMVGELNDEAMAIFEFFISLRVIPATRLKIFCERVLNEVVEQLGKPAKIEFTIEPGVEVDMAVIECLEGSFVHLIRNSIDHGTEDIEARRKAGKKEEALLKIAVTRDGTEKLSCILVDDGKGIDRNALKNAVAKKQLLSQDALDKLTDQSIDELIFIEGLSTRAEVTETSGRGVGMDAVKKRIEEMGGSIQVKSTPGKGVGFKISLPRIFKL
ncbi:response regulator [Bdellovibrionota bacterium FG-1]